MGRLQMSTYREYHEALWKKWRDDRFEYEQISEPIHQRMASLFVMHTEPNLVFQDGKLLRSDTIWKDESAKRLYDTYKRTLELLAFMIGSRNDPSLWPSPDSK